MCGITAYAGSKEALPFILQGLSKLEYRGYDSAGVTLIEDGQLFTRKAKGRLSNLEDLLEGESLKSKIGIGHTRWATHGVPSNTNSHPHTNTNNTISLVHNGIIENFETLKEKLIAMGYEFQSETDSEVVVHYLDHFYDGNMIQTIRKVVDKLEGSFALSIITTNEPDKVWITKKDTPIVIGKDENSSFAASDIPAILDYTKDVYFIDDYDMCVLEGNKVTFYDSKGNEIGKEATHIPYDNEAAKKGGFSTYMEKEINEQPHVIQETLRGRLEDNDVNIPELDQFKERFNSINRVYFVACGTAYNSSISGASLFQEATGLPCFAQAASEFRYGNVILDENTLVILVSQSGETADTLAALRKAKDFNALTITVANVLGSSLAREADGCIFTKAGIEIAVASTKAYTTQIVLLLLLALYFAKAIGKDLTRFEGIINDIKKLPALVDEIIQDQKIFKKYAKTIAEKDHAYYIGRGLDYASAQEGSLKLKEVSYIHADAYYAGELKHGPIALIEQDTNVIALATQKNIAAKTISNIQETMARGANVFLFTTKDQEVGNIDNIYYLPVINELLQSVLVAIPLQMIALYGAKYRKCDVDKPRNLAKSVTVE